MTFLATLAFLTVPYLAVFVLLSILGIGAGYLLRWMLGISLDSAIISGMIVANVSVYFALRVYAALPPLFVDELTEDEDDDDEMPVVYVTDSHPLRRRQKRKRR